MNWHWKKIASEGKGSYIRATNSDDGLEAAMAQIGEMEKIFGTKFTDYEDHVFEYFLAAGILFFMFLENIIEYSKKQMDPKTQFIWWNNKALKTEGR